MDSSLGLYAIVLMLVICTVALWEAGKGCMKTKSEAMRLRSLQSEAKLTKKEMRQLNGLLQRDPMGLSEEERLELINLAETAGVDKSKLLFVNESYAALAKDEHI